MPALHNGLTSNPKLVEAYRRALGEMSQGFSGLERGSESLQPVMDLWSLPEWALLRGEIMFSRQADVGAGGAGTFSALELVNPTGSGVLAVVFEVWSGGAATVQVAVDSGVALGVLGTLRGLANDCRFPQLGEVSRCTVVQGALAAGVALPQDALRTGDRSRRPYIVQPGKKLMVINPTANSAVSLGFFWSERILLNNEQNP